MSAKQPLFQDNLGKLAPERHNHLDFTEVRDDGKWRVPGQEVDQRKLGERLWKKTVEYVD